MTHATLLLVGLTKKKQTHILILSNQMTKADKDQPVVGRVAHTLSQPGVVAASWFSAPIAEIAVHANVCGQNTTQFHPE